LKPWFFFTLLLSKCLNWKIYCDDHSSLSLVHQSISTLKEKPKSSISNRTKRSALFLVANIPVHNILKGPFWIPIYTCLYFNSWKLYRFIDLRPGKGPLPSGVSLYTLLRGVPQWGRWLPLVNPQLLWPNENKDA